MDYCIYKLGQTIEGNKFPLKKKRINDAFPLSTLLQTSQYIYIHINIISIAPFTDSY